MLYLLLAIAVFGAIDDIASNGERLRFLNIPLLTRLRWFTTGILVAFCIADYELAPNHPFTWVLTLALLVSFAKARATNQIPAQPQRD